MTDARLRRDVAWNLVPVALLGAVGLGLQFAIGRWWSAAALGVFNQVTTAFFVLAVLGAGGLQYAVLKAIAEAPEDRARVAAIVVGALVPNVVLAAAATALFVAVRAPVADLLDSAAVARGMTWAAPGLFCFAINKVLLSGVVNGQRRMRAFAVYTSLRYVLIAVGLIGAWQADVAGDHLAAIWTFAEGALLVVLCVEVVATVPLARCAGWTTWTRAHLGFGARGVLATLAYEINTKLDVWMLGIALDDREVGYYSLAAALNEGVAQLAVAVQNNVNPVIARALAAGDTSAVVALVRRTRRWFVPSLAAICALAAVSFPVVVPWLVGDRQFATASVPFAILMAGVVVASPYQPFNQILLMAGRPGWHTLMLAAVVAVGFAANRALIPSYAATGAALATSIMAVTIAVLVRALARARVGVTL